MSTPIIIPIIEKVERKTRKTGTASLTSKVKEQAQEVITKLNVDENTLKQCLEAAQNLISLVEKNTDNKRVALDSITIQLGVTATGKVGFMGTGLDLQVAASIQLTLKIS